MTLSQIKNLILIILGILIPSFLAGQPQPCDMTNPEMTPTCGEACIICDIDGFTGRHESDVEGSLPDDFCTMRVHNAQWIAFQAASTSLTISLRVSNCQIGSGLELAIYKSTDCNNFTLISNCLGAMEAVMEGETAQFQTTEPLVIGQHYYLTMDGARADNCDWTLEVLAGSTEVTPLTVTAPIQGEDRFCPGLMQTFTTEPEIGAVIFEWTLNGQAVGSNLNPFVDLELDDVGFYELCVAAKNTCDETDPVCKQFEVYIIPPTIIVDEFCSTECYEIDGNTFCETGSFSYDIPLTNGCDSTIMLELTQLDQAVNNISFNICEGDTINIGTTPFFTTGSHSATVLNAMQCDSIVNLELRVIICNIETLFSTVTNDCFGASNGSVTFSVDRGTPPFTYDWQHLQTGEQGSGDLPNTDEDITIPNLPTGLVVIEINDTFGDVTVIIVQVEEPALLESVATITDYNGFNVSCNGAADGTIELSNTGGQLPYTYAWSNGNTGAIVTNLEAGTNRVTLTDNLGCELIEEFNLVEPNELSAEALFFNPSCDGLETGQIEVVAVSGGTNTYSYSINGGVFSSISNFDGLPPAEYLITIEDTNGCTFEITDQLTAAQIPVISGTTDYTTTLGCEIQLNMILNAIDIQEIYWLDSTYLSCANCLRPDALPVNSGINSIVVTSIDNCTDSLTINIQVDKLRSFYAPNIFSPRNQDGFNDRFSLYGGKEVERIDLTIFDRWGSTIFQQLDMNPIDVQRGWDGTFKGSPVPVGVYAWVANILFIDGHSQIFSGDISTVK